MNQTDRAVSELHKAYRASRRRLAKIAASADSTPIKVQRSRELIRQINVEVRRLNEVSAVVSKAAISDAYGAAAAKTARVVDTVPNLGTRIHTSAVSNLVLGMTDDLTEANAAVGRFYKGAVRISQQKIVTDKLLSQKVAQGLIEGETRKGVSNSIYDAMKKRIGAGQTLRINGRNYNPYKYSETVARTRTREASSNGTINTALELGMDLVRVSDHENPSDICVPFAGNIYSISGSSKKYPRLTEYPPYHPNCKHTVSAIDEGTEREREKEAAR